MITEYKETAIGRIPKDWEPIRLGKASTVGMLAGYAFSSTFFNGDRGVPLIRIRDLGKDSTEALYNGPYDEEYLISPGEILIGMDGEFKAHIWRGPRGLLNQRVLKIWSKNEDYIDSLYLYYALHKPLRLIELQVGQTTVKHLSTRHFDRITIPLPPIAEQRKIAEALSSVDNAIRLVNDVIDKTQRLKKGLMHKLLAGGIGHKEFKQTKVGRIPKTWKVVRIGDVTEKVKRGPFGGSIKKEIFVPQGYKVYEQKNVINNDFEIGDYYIDEKKFHEMKSFAIKEDDILLTGAGTIGRIAIVPKNFKPGIINQALIKITVNRNMVLVSYFASLFRHEIFRRRVLERSHGATMKNVSSIKELKSIRIPLPSLHEQQRISEVLSSVGKKLDLERKRKDKFERIKRGLMNDLLTGRRRVKVAM